MKAILAGAFGRIGAMLAIVVAGMTTSSGVEAQTAPQQWTAVLPVVGDALACGNSGCHGIPPALGGFTPIPIGNASFFPTAPGALASSSDIQAFVTAVNGAGTSNAVPEMQTLADPYATTIYNYLLQVRDAVVVRADLPFSSTVIGQANTTPATVTVANLRGEALGFTAQISGTDAVDFSVTGTSGCGGASSPFTVASASSSGAASTCSLSVTFTPRSSSSATLRSASLTIHFTSGTLVTPPDRSIVLSGGAMLPLGLSTASLSLASAPTIPVAGSVLLTNRSAATLTLGTLGFTGVGSAAYALASTNACTPGLVLPGNGGQCLLNVTFTPPSGGTYLAMLTITHNAFGSPQTVTLSGLGGQGGQISLSATSLSFPDTQLGSSAAQPAITVSNNAGTGPLTFSAFAFTGAAAADYAQSGTCSTGSPLLVGGQCTVIVTFQPSALGTRSASLSITSDSMSGSPTSIALTGTGTPPIPRAALAPASVAFSAQTLGGIYPSIPVTLTNTGTAPLMPTGITVTAGFSITGAGTPCLSTLAVGASCTIPIAFAPTAAGTVNGTLTVVSNDPASPSTVALTGSASAAAAPSLVWSPLIATLDFGQVAVGAVAPAQTATLLNNGPGGVNLTVINAVGANSTSFSVGAGTCVAGTPLYAGQSCTISVGFAPGTAGTQAATLQVASVEGNPQTSVFPPTLTLTGTGIGGPTPGIALSASTLSFAATTVGAASVPAVLTLTGSGSGVVHVTALAVSGPYAVQSQSCLGVPFTLQAGSSCTLTVTFAPQASGTAAGVLSLTSDASAAPQQVALSGNGQPAADVTSGGCTLAGADSLTDPTLWAMAALALASLWYRRRERTSRRRADHGRGREKP
jgi:hypothetical protein